MGIEIRDPLEIFVDEDQIIMKKYKADKACFITGEISDKNIQLPGGAYVSPEGKEILKEYLPD
ncbi:hypothetical protein ACFFGV_00365 [Pontibacillus salicampi]|uniref:AbrB C-terminal domain-containing protein n=1 Tax=Pontibacillus salicampi TaxID=1449801 RepID=A0ABV6LI26_9BACI